jgi:hypothetical protein
MPMMVNDGSLGVKQPLAVLLDQDFGKDASKNNSISADIVSQDPTNHPATTTINLLLLLLQWTKSAQLIRRALFQNLDLIG